MGGGGVGGAEAVDWEETAVGVVGAISDTSVDTALELPVVQIAQTQKLQEAQLINTFKPKLSLGWDLSG